MAGSNKNGFQFSFAKLDSVFSRERHSRPQAHNNTKAISGNKQKRLQSSGKTPIPSVVKYQTISPQMYCQLQSCFTDST